MSKIHRLFLFTFIQTFPSMIKRLKIEFRQKQLYLDNDLAHPVVIDCSGGSLATYTPGTVPKPNFQDMTDFTDGLDDYSTEWQALNSGQASTDDGAGTNDLGSNYSKGVSDDLIFTGDAFQYIFDWLMVTPCQALNSVEARITDLDCGKSFRIFEIKLDNTKYDPFNEPCIIRMPLREKDDIIFSLQKSIIEDDWQGWFNSDGTSTKDHPTFMYVVEKRPAFFLDILLVIAYLVGILSGGIATLFTEVKQWYHKICGLTYFVPAPFIKTYIDNICQKYGYTSNTIFDSGNYAQLCLFFPVESYYTNHDSFDSPSTKFIWQNRTGKPFTTFLDELKQVFNARWYCTPNKELIFQNKAFFLNQSPIYDFSTGAFTPINFTYNFNGNKKPAYGDYEYNIDPQDNASNDLKWRYNDIVDYDGPANNPMLEGNVTKNFNFACTSFMYDGNDEDFIKRGVNFARIVASGTAAVGLAAMLATAAVFTGVIVAAMVFAGFAFTNSYFNGNIVGIGELDGAVRLAYNVVNMPRLLLRDAASSLVRSKVVSVVNPAINAYYNTDGVDYYTEHHGIDQAGFADGVTKVFNYPMYVDAKFTGNLYDRFHEIDNPLKTPSINQSWEMDLQLCCDLLILLGVFDDTFIKIGAVVIIETRNRGTADERQIKGEITYIKVDYKTGLIHLQGNVII